MPGPRHQWLYLQGFDDAVEIFNGARTAAYLASSALQLPSGIVNDVLPFGGCQAYAFDPPCDTDDAFIQTYGVAGNNTSAPDSAALDIVGDITLIADISLPDWTPSVKQGVIGKWTTAGQLSYRLSVLTTGALMFEWTSNGTTINSATSSATLGALPNDSRRSIRVDFDVDNGASGRTARFWVANNHDSVYAALGVAQVSATVTSLFASTSIVTFNQAGTDPMTGKLFWAQVRSGQSGTANVGGASILTVDPNLIGDTAATTWSAGTGQTMTIAKSGGTPTTVSLGPAWWERKTYSTPALDDAPWYSASRPESGDVLGFWIDEWTGLDDAHVSRGVQRTGRPGGGGQLGSLNSNERVMALNVTVVTRSEKASEYAFRWLSTTLNQVCSSCQTNKMLVRRHCPTPTDLWDGVVEMREVGLVEGVKWIEDPISRGACFIRRLSFTLAAGDPCMYLPPYTVSGFSQGSASACFNALPLSPGKSTCRPTCISLPASCRTVFTFEVDPFGGAAPVLTLANEANAPVPPLRIICYNDPNKVGVLPNPCGLEILGEIYTGVIPGWTTMTWDVIGRKVWMSDHTTPTDVPGFRLIEANDLPHRRFFTLPCGTSHIVIEPANVCLTKDTPNSRYTYGGYSFLWSELHWPTPTLEIQERVSCA